MNETEITWNEIMKIECEKPLDNKVFNLSLRDKSIAIRGVSEIMYFKVRSLNSGKRAS